MAGIQSLVRQAAPPRAGIPQSLGLNSQEQGLYQRHLDNLYGPGGVDNPDGSRSTLRQMIIGADDRFYNLPTVWDGKILAPRDAVARAQSVPGGLNSFPSYPTEKEAEERYQAMHQFMDQDTAAYLKGKTGN